MEAVLATFLLLTTVLLSIFLFHSSLRAEAGNEKRVVAAMVAETVLAEIRDEAGRNFANLVSQYDGRSWVPEKEPSTEVFVRASPSQLSLACTELENQYPVGNSFPDPERRLLTRSAVDVEVEVRWRDPAPASMTVLEKVTNLRAATGFTVEILSDSGTTPPPITNLAKGATADFRARAKADGQEVHDIQFTWYVQPVIGFGQLSAVSRNGLNCTYQNAYRNHNDELRYSAGACFLTLKATYQGQESQAQVRIDNEA